MKRVLAIALCAMLMLTMLAGCGQGGTDPTPAPTPATNTPAVGTNAPVEEGFVLPAAPGSPALIQFAGGASGGTFFLIANAVAQVLNNYYPDYVKCSTQATSGSVEILNLLESGEIDFGWSQSGMAAQAVAGTEPFDAPHGNIASVVYGYPNVCQILVTNSSGVNSVDELKGHTFSVGGTGSAAELNMREICAAYGLDYVNASDFRAEYASDSDFPDMIANRQIDGAFSASAIGASAVVNALTTGDCKILSLSDEVIDALCEQNSAYFKYVIPAGTYANQDYEVQTVAIANYIYCRADLDDTTVQVFLDAVFNNLEELALSHSAVSNISHETAVSGLTVPLHPAAAAYYEAVGVELG